MKVVKCANGHFFDLDTYSKCPICEAPFDLDKTDDRQETSGDHKEKSKILPTNVNEGLKGIKRLFGRMQEKEILTEKKTAPENRSDVAYTRKETPAEVKCKEEDEETEAIYKRNQVVFDDEKTESMFSINKQAEVVAENVKKEEQPYSVDPEVESLQEAIHQVSASDDGKTMSFFSAVLDSANSNERAAKKSTEPVVGWLVCVSGSHFGEGFSIRAGMNSIGRNASNSIVVSKDGSVSREKHAFVVYEPRKREFYVKPGESSGLTYVNDDYITDTVKIKNRDIVEVGNSKMIFVPLCDDSFSWEDYMNKNR